MNTFAVVNPRSGGGRTGRQWAAIRLQLRTTLGDVAMAMTTAPGDGKRLARVALETGYRHIVAIGGDGTLNEVVNGLFEGETPIAPDVAFSFAMSGSGGDFRRSFGIEGGVLDQIARLKGATPRKIDLGLVEAIGGNGAPAQRLFLNIASFGLSGDIVERVNRARIAKWFGGPFAFKWHSIRGVLAFKPSPIRWRTDEQPAEVARLSTLAVCNGRYFGGGMMVAPNADPSDGLFDVVTIAQTPRRAMIAQMNDIYAGKHIGHPNVTVTRAGRVTAAPAEGQTAPVLIECDGEGGLRLPASFRVVPGALTVMI